MKVQCPLKDGFYCECTEYAGCTCICPLVLDQYAETRRDGFFSGLVRPPLRARTAPGAVA